MNMKFFLPLLFLLFYSAKAPATVGEPNVIWRKLPIRVCFSGWDSKRHGVFLEAIKQKITAEYTPQRTIVHFSGWKDCNTLEASQFDVQIKPSDEGDSLVGRAGNSPVGENSIQNSSGEYVRNSKVTEQMVHLFDPYEFSYGSMGYKLREKVGKLAVIDFMALTALHELGHVASLRHEHLHREDFLSDESCKKVISLDTRTLMEAEQFSSATAFFGKYDEVSAMNYCHYNNIIKKGLRKSIYLSPQDVQTLRSLYKDVNPF